MFSDPAGSHTLFTASYSSAPDTAVPSGLSTTYVDLVTSSNEATCTFNRALSRKPHVLEDMAAASADYAASLATLAHGIDVLGWPAAYAEHADALVAALGVQRDIAIQMAAAATMEDFLANNDRLLVANDLTAEAAQWVRADLDLSIPGDPCAS